MKKIIIIGVIGAALVGGVVVPMETKATRVLKDDASYEEIIQEKNKPNINRQRVDVRPFAESAREATGQQTTVGSIEDVQGIIQDVVGWFQVFFYTFAVIFILLGAWDYLSSGGEPEKTKSGRNKIIYGLVAIAIAVIAGGVVRLVFNFVEGT
ncbi:MAG: hypothetical protein Q8R20_00420 [Nanoarchaeota archaeon]|nr:hypothetical protein [Nanoarchaeota archaeon]